MIILLNETSIGGLHYKLYCQRLTILEPDSPQLRRIRTDLGYFCVTQRSIIWLILMHPGQAYFFTLSNCRLTRSNGVDLKSLTVAVVSNDI